MFCDTGAVTGNLRRSRLTWLLAPLLVMAALTPMASPAHADPAWDREFYWGAAQSGYQAEGGRTAGSDPADTMPPDSNWSRYVDANAGNGQVDPYERSNDFRNRYREDIANARAMGLNTFRFGVEWARVQPAPGVWDETELAYYDDVVATIEAAGMTPMITLIHYVYPGWAADRGGMLNPANVDAFGEYARAITARYADRGALWVAVNEPLVFVRHELEIGAIGPQQAGQLLDALERAHRLSYAAAHAADPAAKVTSNEAFLPAVTPVTDALFSDRIADVLDYVGIDYYYGVALDNLTAINAAWNDFWAVRPQPEDIYHALRHYSDRFPGKPLYIVENGLPTDGDRDEPGAHPRADGVDRADNLRDTIFWVQRASADGMNVIGYNYWSIADNYEWGSYRPRFGLYTVDALTDPALTRTPTDAVAAYREITARGGTAEGYRPVSPLVTCSLASIPRSCAEPADPGGPVRLLGPGLP